MANGTSFGDLLRRYRTMAGLSQELLAERAGLTPNGIGGLERGLRKRPHPHTIHAIAEALDLSTAERAALIDAASGRRPERTAPAQVVQPAQLPIPPSPLIGRDEVVRHVSELLQEESTRLVTLTGIGGVGKTRLALEIARTAGSAWPDGVVFVSLAALTDPALVLPTLARAIGLHELPGDQVRQQLLTRLKSRRWLLVLDNLEHVLPAVAGDLADILIAADTVTILATSRAPIQIRGELEIPVDPLPFGASGVETDKARGTAMDLFVLRAREVRPAFAVTEPNAATIAAICRQLGGLPLAIELAAAWIRVLTPEDLLSRLDHVLSVEGARDLPTRQRTMRATLDWSHSLLVSEEQVLFRRLAVFTGGFTLEAAEAVCPDAPNANAQVLAGVGRLVEHSLVSVNPAAEPVRYSMLEPVRQYAGEHLAASGEGATLRGRHSDYFLSLAQQAETGLVGPDQARWLRHFDAEHPNLRSTLRWLTDTAEIERVVELGWNIIQFWITRGHFNEGARWLESILAQEDSLRSINRARLRFAVAYLITGQGRLAEAIDLLEGAVEAARDAGRDDVRVAVHGMAAAIATYAGELDRGGRHAASARTLDASQPWSWHMLGVYVYDAIAAIEEGNLDAARGVLANAETQMRTAGCWWPLMHILNLQSQAAVAQGDVDGAAAACRMAVDVARHIGVTLALPDSLALLGGALVLAGRSLLAARLFGALEAFRERMGDTMIVTSRRQAYQEHVAEITAQLGEKATAEAWQAGRDARLDDVIDESLAVFPPE